jgi:RNA polymerase sigma-70 factor (ECF subfamily)
LAIVAAPLFVLKNRRVDSKTMSNEPEIQNPNASVGTFEELAMPLMPLMYGLAKHWTQNVTDAEDLVAETYLKAFKAFKQFQQGTSMKAWMSTIMRNTFYNNQAKVSRDKAKDSISNKEEWEIAGAVSLTSTIERSAETQALDNMPAEIVVKALNSINQDFAEVVRMAIVADMSYAEIAEELGIAMGTVMSRLHRGKAELRKLLAEYAAEQGIGLNYEKKSIQPGKSK